jgi:hypothetical protein
MDPIDESDAMEEVVIGREDRKEPGEKVSPFGCRYPGEIGEGSSGDSCWIGNSSDTGRANCVGGCSLLGERGGRSGVESTRSVVMFGSGHCGDGEFDSMSPLLPEGVSFCDCSTCS